MATRQASCEWTMSLLGRQLAKAAVDALSTSTKHRANATTQLGFYSPYQITWSLLAAVVSTYLASPGRDPNDRFDHLHAQKARMVEAQALQTESERLSLTVCLRSPVLLLPLLSSVAPASDGQLPPCARSSRSPLACLLPAQSSGLRWRSPSAYRYGRPRASEAG